VSGSQIYSSFAFAETQRVVFAGGAYALGPTTVGGTYSKQYAVHRLGRDCCDRAAFWFAEFHNTKPNNVEANFKIN
jgi:hypothetical protein